MNRSPQSVSDVVIPFALVNSIGGNATGEVQANFRVWVRDPSGAVVAGFDGMTPDGTIVTVSEIGTTGVYLVKFPTAAATKAFTTANAGGPYTVVIDVGGGTNASAIDPCMAEVYIGTLLNTVATATALSDVATACSQLLTNVAAIPTTKTGYSLVSAYDPAKTAAQASDSLAVLNAQMTESYAAKGAAPSLAQALCMILSLLSEKTITGATLSAKRLDGLTEAASFDLTTDPAPAAFKAITRVS